MSLLSSLIGFFEGRVKIYADAESKAALVSYFVNNGITAKMLDDAEKGGVYTEISPDLLKKIAPALDKLNIMVYIINIYGFKRLCSRYGRRYGLMLGAAVFSLLLWLSTLFIWRVDVSGADKISGDELRNELSELGVRVGAKISDIDRFKVSNELLKEHPELSWAALNFTGTTVELKLKETEAEQDGTLSEPTRVLVASESGVVKSVLVYGGNATVKVGSVVSKGDVLIIGLISDGEDEAPELRFMNAAGSVTAEVVRMVSVEIPFTEERVYSEYGERRGTVISVFGHELSFGSTEGAVLESEKHVTFFGSVEIPVTVKSFVEQRTVSSSFSRDTETARLSAEETLYKKIAETLGDGELTYVKTEYTETESGWLARAEIGCTVEIAVPYGGLSEKP